MVLELRQLHLQLRLPRPGAVREDVENQFRAVDDPDSGFPLQVSDLHRGEVMIEHHEIGLPGAAQLGQFRDFAFPNE